MHMADALLAPGVATTMYVASAAVAGLSIYNIKKEDSKDLTVSTKRIPTMAVMSALVFAGQMINYTIPGTGSSGHLCGGMMLTALLGPWAGFLSMIAVLLIQCLFFADGGLMALGTNIWNMAFYGCFVGYFLIYRPIMKSKLLENKGSKNAYRLKIILSSILGCVLTLQLGAFSVVLETSASGITDIPFGAFVGLMQPIHFFIGLIEGVVTSAVIIFVYETRPELVKDVNLDSKVSNKLKLGSTIATLAIVVAIVGGGLSLFASSHPDGLEWSLFGNAEEGYSANLALDEEDYGMTSSFAENASAVQEKTAFLPDYAFSNDSENPLGTSVSGIVGSAIVAVLAIGICFVGKSYKKKGTIA